MCVDLLAPLTVRCLFFSALGFVQAVCFPVWDLQARSSQVLGVSFSGSVLCLFFSVSVSFWGVLGSALSFPSGSGLFPVLFPSPSSFLLGSVLELQWLSKPEYTNRFFIGAWRLGQHPKLYLIRIFQRASQ